MITTSTFPNITKMYQEFLDAGDPRVASWPMMDSPMKGITLVIMYLGFVKVAGPAFMRDQKPYDLRYIMAAYNFALVAISGWMFLEFGIHGWFTKYSWRCEPIDYSYDPDALRIAEIGWYFYITKFIEFADTIFFILRKKDSQASTLHVFHHSLVPITLWFGIKYAPGGYNSIFAFLNSFVHTVMYLYYGLAALGPSYQKYLWWKKYLTIIQIVQFTLVLGFMFQLTFFPACEVSKPMLILNGVQAVIFFALFLNFFRDSYRRKKRKQGQTAKPSQPPAKESQRNSSSSTSAGHTTCASAHKENGYTRNRIASVRRDMDSASAIKYLDINYIAETVTIPT